MAAVHTVSKSSEKEKIRRADLEGLETAKQQEKEFRAKHQSHYVWDGQLKAFMLTKK